MIHPLPRLVRSVPRCAARQGFTLVEMMVGLVVSSVLIAGLMTGFFFQRKTLHAQQQINDMEQNVRSALGTLADDINMAGYGINVSDYELLQWVTWDPFLSTNPTLIENTNGTPEVVIMVGAFTPPPRRPASRRRPGRFDDVRTVGECGGAV